MLLQPQYPDPTSFHRFRRSFSVGLIGSFLLVGSVSAQEPALPRSPIEAGRPFLKTVVPTIPSIDQTKDALPTVSKPIDATRPVQTPPAKPHSISDRADIEEFFDTVLSLQIESKHIAGAVAAVVVGDKVLFAKGYGYADVEQRRKVDPETTQFRIASVSKLFTWAAVMQLVEQGKLDLDKDVNTYLTNLKIPATFPQPITLKHLLTHTPGFEDGVIGLFAHDAKEVGPLGDVLRRQMPARVRPPGILASYSNHGTAIAGDVVAAVSAMPWEDLIELRLLKPLGMNHTLVRQPPKDKLPETLSKGYKWEKGLYAEQGFEYVPAAPAGSMSATAVDMTKFLIAHLNDGVYKNARILKPETARRMRERLFAHDPKVDAMCYGFPEMHRNGQRILHHGGDTLVFHTLFAMIPEQHLGIFVSYNTDRGASARDELLTVFLDRYFPQSEKPRPKADDDAVASNRRFEGQYTLTRHSETTYAKLAMLLAAMRLKANQDGTLSLSNSNGERRFVKVEPLVLQEVEGRMRLVFREDDRGQIADMFFGDVPVIAAVRNPWYEEASLHRGLMVAAAVLFATALLFWPVIAFCGRGLRSPLIRRTHLSATLSVIAWLLSAACLAFLVILVMELEDPNEIAFGTPPWVQKLLVVPIACGVLTVLTLVGSMVAWARRYWRVSGRVHYTLVALAGIAFCGLAYYWKLLDVNVLSAITR